MTLRAERRKGRIFVALAALAWSSAGLLQRELTVGVATQLAGRALFASLAMIAYVAVIERGRVARSFRDVGSAGIGIAVLMAISSGSFIVALNHASVANVFFMQAISPMLAALIGMLLGEPVARRTWAAMAIAVAGVGLMVGGPGHAGPTGLFFSFVMALSFAGVIVLTRHRRDVSMAPAACLSQVIVFVAAAPFAGVGAAGPQDGLLLVLLGVGQMGLGLVFLTIGGRLLPAAEGALITLLEIVLGPLWVAVFLSEWPGTATLAGGAIVLGAVAYQALGESPEHDPEERVPERRLGEPALREERGEARGAPGGVIPVDERA